MNTSNLRPMLRNMDPTSVVILNTLHTLVETYKGGELAMLSLKSEPAIIRVILLSATNHDSSRRRSNQGHTEERKLQKKRGKLVPSRYFYKSSTFMDRKLSCTPTETWQPGSLALARMLWGHFRPRGKALGQVGVPGQSSQENRRPGKVLGNLENRPMKIPVPRYLRSRPWRVVLDSYDIYNRGFTKSDLL
ncbi:uncharacterized protein BDR25DRAFT_351980 [Lindgomyces ingoldianus]|uniref:Uncharacterized protein n=1 Tax=Lindgomyces ingoldianus TaxID=673940 RepID=A0ACB6R5B5_9PLEO|nr:uncharacterized protein BDR25DRAFT_351980 [Lindgomyces ingoldianus]KAF2474429.1 hypothetical protein BDR25DRAFT_351980 [Lindgomyces ingoldianus]